MCLAVAIVILKVAHCPELLLCFHYCLYIWKYSLNNFAVLYFSFFINLYALLIIIHYSISSTFFIDCYWSSDWSPSEIFLCSSHFLIYSPCAFYPWLFRFSDNIIPWKSIWRFSTFRGLKTFSLNFSEFTCSVLLGRRRGCALAVPVDLAAASVQVAVLEHV